MSGRDDSGTFFINVDLDIWASKGLDDLVEALKPAMEISRDERRVTLELIRDPKSAENAIKQFVKLVQKLPPKKRALWNKAKRKTMNIGIQAGLKPNSMVFTLSSEVISLLDSVGADIGFTVYAPKKEQ